VTADRKELEDYTVKLVDHLKWALDLMAMYEKRLLAFGDPKEMVHSFVHINRVFEARGVIEGAWQTLKENSVCSYCADGNVPLAGWHSYADGPEPCRDCGEDRGGER